MWAILWFLTWQNYPLYKNSSVENQTWPVTSRFDISAIFFSISRDILMSISSIQEMSLSNRVACEHAIKLIFVDSAGCGLVLVLVVCCDNVLHCLIAACAKKWRVLENQGGNGKLVIMHSTCFKNWYLKMCIAKTWSVF